MTNICKTTAKTSSGGGENCGPAWTVATVSESGEKNVEEYSHVVVCNGMYSVKCIPGFDQDARDFSGIKMHSSEFEVKIELSAEPFPFAWIALLDIRYLIDKAAAELA